MPSLANPAAAPVQFMGVYSRDLLVPMAEVLKLLGLRAALVVHSDEGLDEVSPVAPTDYALLYNGEITTGRYTPQPQVHLHSLSAITTFTPSSAVPFAAQSRDEPEPYSFPDRITSGTPASA